MRARVAAVVLSGWAAAAAAAPRTFAIDGGKSTAEAHVGRTGIGFFAGHEHRVVARNIQGEVAFDADNLAASSVDLIVGTATLRVAEAGEPEGDAAKVQAVMRGPDVLDVARFATIHFGSLSVTGKPAAPGVWDVAVSGELSLHGVAKSVTVPVHVEVQGDVLTVSGELSLKQTDFGIEPTSAAGGLVKVENEVALTFRIEARAM